MERKRIVIVGAGPAGIACAIQLRRYGLDPYLIEKDTVGGLLLNANLVENYPGFPSGISGGDLAGLFKSQLERFDINTHVMEVEKLECVKNGYYISTDKEEMEIETVVVASGTDPKKLDIKNTPAREKVLYDVKGLKGIKQKRICILGGADAAFDYALGLSSHNSVTIVHRGDSVSCLPILLQRANNDPRIKIQLKIILDSIGEVDGKMLLRFSPEKEIEKFDTVIAAIGRIPSVPFLSNDLMKKFISKGKAENLYFIGDVVRGLQRQVGIAVGDGIKTAMQIYMKRNDQIPISNDQ